MIIALVVIVALIFVPVFLSGYGYFDYSQKKLFFCLKLFTLFQLFGGYIEIFKGLIVIHYKKDKAIAFGVFDGGMSLDLSFLKDFSILELKAHLSLSATENSIRFAVVENVIANNVLSYIKSNNADAKIVRNVEIGKDEKVRFYLKLSILFNIISIIKLLIKTLGGKNGKKRKN